MLVRQRDTKEKSNTKCFSRSLMSVSKCLVESFISVSKCFIIA